MIYYKKIERFNKNALDWSIFELEKRSFFLNRSECRQKLNSTIIRGLVRHKTLTKTLRGEVSHQGGRGGRNRSVSKNQGYN